MGDALGLVKIHMIRADIRKNDYVTNANLASKTHRAGKKNVALETEIAEKKVFVFADFSCVRIIDERIGREFFLAHTERKRVCIENDTVSSNGDDFGRDISDSREETSSRFDPEFDAVFFEKSGNARIECV